MAQSMDAGPPSLFPLGEPALFKQCINSFLCPFLSVSDHNFEYDEGDPWLYLSGSKIAEHISCDGGYHFKMVWPDDNLYIEFRQATNPTVETTVTGLERKFEKRPSSLPGIAWSSPVRMPGRDALFCSAY